MSLMKEFYEKVAQNSALQAAFNQIMKEAQEAGASSNQAMQHTTEEKLQAFAKGAGYDISTQEMRDFFTDQLKSDDGELSSLELDMVAGGKSAGGTMSIMASIITPIACGIGSAIGEIIQKDGCANQFK